MKLFVTATQNDGQQVVDAESLSEQGECDEVDDVPGPADDPELEELHPVLRLPRPEMDTPDQRPAPVGRASARVARAGAATDRQDLVGSAVRGHLAAPATLAARSSGPSPRSK